MKLTASLVFSILIVLLAGCQRTSQVCPPTTGTPKYLTILPDELPTPTPASGPFQVVIGRKEMLVDKVVEGPLCNDSWSGVVYVTCNTQVYAWSEEQPTFLKDCTLNIDPGTIAYVAYHNNAAYYKGCSCHTGESPEP
jgi:hypothetical protein